MHLLVLSAFRQPREPLTAWARPCLNAPFGAQCFPTRHCFGGTRRILVSMHLLVLSAFRLVNTDHEDWVRYVSMHLLVLSAFRPAWGNDYPGVTVGLNAPFGAQCFPTCIR